MSRISQNFINNIGFLYENIYTQEQNVLNEESEFFDEEVAELVEDILLSVSLSMFSEGYNAETVTKFFASSDEVDILEKYLTTDFSLLSEETINTEFVEEQFIILEKFGLGRLLSGLFKGARKAAPATRAAGRKGVERVATAGVERRVGSQFTRSTDVSRTQRALERVARTKAQKSGVTAPQGALSPRQSTELLKQSRVATAIRNIKGGAKNALLAGLGVLSGYVGAKLGGSGGGEPGVSDGAKESPVADTDAGVVKDYTAFKAGGGGAKSRETGMSIRDIEELGRKNLAALKAKGGTTPPSAPQPSGAGGGGGGGRSSGGGNGGGGGKPPTPAPSKPTDGAERRAATALELKRAQEARAAALEAGKSKEDAEKAAVQAGIEASKPTQGPKTTPEQEKDLAQQAAQATKEIQDREKKKLEQQTAKESYDAFDIILEYLTSEGHVDTLDEALYVMMEMDAECIQSICEGHPVAMPTANPPGSSITMPTAKTRDRSVPMPTVKPSGGPSHHKKQHKTRPPVGATVRRYGSDGTVYTHVQR